MASVAPGGAVGSATRAKAVVADDPFRRGGELLVERLRAHARSARGEIRLAIPGGSALAALVAARPQLETVWSRVALTWVDERCVPLTSPDSNRGEAQRRGIGIGARSLPLFEDGESPEQAVRRAERRLVDEFAAGLDVVLLGLGADGHVASLFPDRAWPDDALVGFVPDSPKPPHRRITLARALLATARDTLVVAAGPDKRDAIERLLAGDPRLPATGLPGLVVVTDQTP